MYEAPLVQASICFFFGKNTRAQEPPTYGPPSRKDIIFCCAGLGTERHATQQLPLLVVLPLCLAVSEWQRGCTGVK